MTTPTRLWNVNGSQNTRVFGWREILEEWSYTLTTTPYIDTIRDNLHFATDLPHSYSFPITHFLNYLNYEEEGVKWLIYEICAGRWISGRIRVDYLRQLLDHVQSLDSGFPAFVGSPELTESVREFLESQLTGPELREVQMVPRLVPLQQTYSPPRSAADRSAEFRSAHRSAHRAAYPSPPQLVRQSFATAPAPAPPAARSYPSITLRFIRDDDKENDDVLKILRKDKDTMSVVFNDGEAVHKNRVRNLSRDDVLSYLSNVLRLVSVDEAPYKHVQLLAPNMPTVLISPHNLTSQIRDLLYDAVETTMDHWPLIV